MQLTFVNERIAELNGASSFFSGDARDLFGGEDRGGLLLEEALITAC